MCLNGPVGDASLEPMSIPAAELCPPEPSLSDRELLLLEFERESWKLTVP